MTFFSNNLSILACDQARGWCIFAVPEGQVQLDFGATALLLDAAELPELTELLGSCQDMPARERASRRSRDAGTVCYCAEHGVFVVMVGNAVIRFRAAEFAAVNELMQAALIEMARLLQDDHDITSLD